MTNSSAIYRGTIEHRRLAPKENRFTYSVLYYFLNLDEVERIFRFPFIFSYNFPGVLSFWRKDYFGPTSISIKQAIIEAIKKHTGKDFKGSIFLLTNISYFGFCFNPVSFYYAISERPGMPDFILSEITNTPWGERHTNVFEVIPEAQHQTYRFPKDFHVSPFMPMGVDYTWVFHRPGPSINVYMQNRFKGETEIFFDSNLELVREDLNLKNVLKAFIAFPLVTFKTMMAIYFQAAKLYLKKVPFYTHPSKEKFYDNSTPS